jgi:uncharacterized repeat protein (TIGR01451 family)
VVISKSADPTSAPVGGVITYRLVVTNVSGGAACPTFTPTATETLGTVTATEAARAHWYAE